MTPDRGWPQFSLTDLLRAVGLQPARGLRRRQRCGARVGGPDVSPHRVAQALGPGCGPDIDVALDETDLLTRAENLVGLMAVNRELLAQAGVPTRANRIVLDMDSSESPVHGAQEGSAYNGHFESVCYHPLFLFNEHGDCLAASLRPGNVPSADVG